MGSDPDKETKGVVICVSNKKQLGSVLENICANIAIIKKYSKKAYNCGVMYHDRRKTQEMLIGDMKECIGNEHR